MGISLELFLVLVIWNNAEVKFFRQLILTIRLPFDVIFTLVWLAFLWQGASLKQITRKRNVFIVALILILDLVATILFCTFTEVFNWKTFDLRN